MATGLFFPFFTISVFISLALILFYWRLFPHIKNKIIFYIHVACFVLLEIQIFAFGILNVTNFSGRYTEFIIDIVFTLSFLYLIILSYRSKQKIVEKILNSILLVGVLLIGFMEFTLSYAYSNNLEIKQKYYPLNWRLTIRKEYIDYGQPLEFSIAEKKYFFLEKVRGLSELTESDGEIESIEFISYENGYLKINVKRKDQNKVTGIFLKYDGVYPLRNGMAIVHLNHKQGMIDKYGREIIPIEYDSMNEFYGDLSMVLKNGKIGYIDIHNNVVIPFKYESGGNFIDDRTTVTLNGKQIYIDKKGNEYPKEK